MELWDLWAPPNNPFTSAQANTSALRAPRTALPLGVQVLRTPASPAFPLRRCEFYELSCEGLTRSALTIL
jgi:hypothetical protein